MKNSPMGRKTPNKQTKPQETFSSDDVFLEIMLCYYFSPCFTLIECIENLVYCICGIHNVFDLTKYSTSSPLCDSLALRVSFIFNNSINPSCLYCFNINYSLLSIYQYSNPSEKC